MSDTIDKHTLKLWDMIVEKLEPEATRLVLQQHTKLIHFDLKNGIAKVEINRKQLSNLVKNKVPHLEQAFKSVLHQSIKICLIFNGLPIETESNSTDLLSDVSEKSPVWQDVQKFQSPLQSENYQGSNQGRDAPLKWNGLNFRSQSEIKLAEALDKQNVLYFPNACGRLYSNGKRINLEADFLICDEGKWGILECDGRQYHQIAADDHRRDRLWYSQGICFIQRFSSDECYKNPDQVIAEFLSLLKKFYLRLGNASNQSKE